MRKEPIDACEWRPARPLATGHTLLPRCGAFFPDKPSSVIFVMVQKSKENDFKYFNSYQKLVSKVIKDLVSL